MFQMPIKRFITIVLILTLIASNSWWFIRSRANTSHNTPASDSSKAFPLLSKRIFAENQNDILLDFVPLRKQLESRFKGLSVPYSFYFEYLPSGTSIRIGDDNELVAASLIKVPLAMNLFKAAELGKVSLDEEVTITESEIDGGYGDLWQKGSGAKITLRKAAELALTESDNTASHVIFTHVNGKLSADQESLNNLDIEQNIENGQAVINAKSYSSVLKSLYLSSYLQREDSQEVLRYLTLSTATNRLKAQLPEGVVVAHKIGVFNTNWSESDCGIVYTQKRPYSVCIMVGLEEDRADAFIAETSKIIYEYVTAQ